MITTLDFLYLVLAFCVIALTIMLVLLGSEWLRISRDVRSISRDVQQISHLLERISGVIFPGVERVVKKAAEGVDSVEAKINQFFGSRSAKSKKDSKET